MRDAIELLGSLGAVAWKVLCFGSVLCLGLLILDRRDRPRALRQVRPVERPRERRAA